ncbi:cytochrome c [Candidatus Nitrotoga sp. AM1P]|uniref:cytochrome c n=1 Tax=Candidatus Nitrotoga sp. AM1P TaxID=2559597 RepID=UPI0010AFAF2B|nr:cytochrome c [Candidatus Nitrotoga sp. AM1P]BBJ23907.1 hypothetical protein W01_18340 [Candidatus Nitrotoga sp. AM1P]
MKTSIWLATMAVAVIAALAWFTKQPEIAQAEIATQPSVAQVQAQVQMVSQQNSAYTDNEFHSGEVGLSPSARAGREIWFKATAGNERFHTYTFQQRVGVLIDWFRVLRGDQREQRFQTWGLINDPGCCTPGSPNCPAKSREETYGFDWCPGDETLLKFVGKSGYRDPACDFKDAPAESADPKGHQNGREDACNLAFGTSTGALGFRKFPNPKFDPVAWKKLNGSLGTWEGYDGKISSDPKRNDAKLSRLSDGSIEPPFRIGMACGACHIAFNPAKPPTDPAHPKWENITGLVGNQYIRISEIIVSGMPSDTLEWQVFAHARPGTSDTSAIPTDQINNAGTINALINIAQRPVHDNTQVLRWRKADACPSGAKEHECWCEPNKPGKCWQRSLKTEAVHHILKGGEDSTGALGAIQRVYFNIGSCAEKCWLNHLTDLRQLDPTARNFGQTPFSIGQCRRDCPNFRAIEDRLQDILAFFLSPESAAADLQAARANMHASKVAYGKDDLTVDLEQEFGKGAVSRGRTVFAANCARCHSSSKAPAETVDFHALDPKTGLRADWLGNDALAPASEIGTNRCRALHSNHMQGHVWEEFASENYYARPADPNIPEQNGGGRGYYRNISLLNAWAHAPFLHNNSVGPELCGSNTGSYDFYRNSYVDASKPGYPMLSHDKSPACWKYDPSVDGRFKLYVASMNDLLNPSQRVPKATKLDRDIVLDVGPRVWDGSEEKLIGFSVRIPAGSTAGKVGNFQHKAFIADLIAAKLHPQQLEKNYTPQLGAANAHQLVLTMQETANAIVHDPGKLVDAIKSARARLPLLGEVYSSCNAEIENDGHRFGEDLSPSDKKALIAFLATL